MRDCVLGKHLNSRQWLFVLGEAMTLEKCPFCHRDLQSYQARKKTAATKKKQREVAIRRTKRMQINEAKKARIYKPFQFDSEWKKLKILRILKPEIIKVL